jgi:hypothetical protein
MERAILDISIWNSQHLIVLAFYLYAWLLGSAFLFRFGFWGSGTANRFENTYLQIFFATSIGIAFNILVLFLLGVLGCLFRSVVLLWMIVSLGWAISFLMGKKRVWVLAFLKKSWWKDEIKKPDFWVVVLFLLSIMLSYIRIPGHSDDTMYHLPHAVQYIKHGGLVLNQYLHLPLVPQNINLLFVWGLMFGDFILAQAMATMFVFLLGMGLVGTSIWWIKSKLAGMFATAWLVYSAPVLFTLGFAFVDNGVALFCWAGILAMFYYLEQSVLDNKKEIKWIVLSGLFMGVAIGSKYFAFPVVGLMALWLLWSRQFKACIYFLLSTIFIGCAWYIRSFYFSGNPIHPLGGQLFGYFLWNEFDYHVQIMELNSIALGKEISNWIPSLEHAYVPELVLAFLPILWLKRLPRQMTFLYCLWIIFFFFWFYFAQVFRYLMPILPGVILLTVVTGWDVCQVAFAKLFSKTKIIGSQLLLWLFVAPVIWWCYFAYHLTQDYIKNPVQTLADRPYTGYALYREANRLIPQYGDRLLQLNFDRGIFFFEGIVMGHWLGEVRYHDFGEWYGVGDYEKCILMPPESMIKKMNELNTTMLMLNLVHCEMPPEYGNFFDVRAKRGKGLLLTIKAF